MPRKAKFQGECQVCGRTQKLPHDHLSKHGYTTRCGFFEGTCYGAGHPPFEQSKDLVEDSIKRAEEKKEELQQDKNYFLTSTDNENLVFNAYDDWSKGGKWFRKAGYRLIVGKVEERKRTIGSSETGRALTFSDFFFIAELPEGRHYETRLRFGCQGNTIESVVKFLNAQEAERLQRKIEEVSSYISWQKRRIKDWKKKPLTPVDD